jgi:hypothetical protein
MNDLLAARQEASFGRAQAHYDAMGPPEPIECRFCDGTGKVTVASVLDCDCVEHEWPNSIVLGGKSFPDGPEVECPFCIDGAPQPDPDWEIGRRDSLEDLPR